MEIRARLKEVEWSRRGEVARQVVAELAGDPEMRHAAEAMQRWGVDHDEFAVGVLEDRSLTLRQLASRVTPHQDAALQRRQLEEFGEEPVARMALELFDAAKSSQLKQHVWSEAMHCERGEVFNFAWFLNMHLRFADAGFKELLATKAFQAMDEEHRWMPEALERWGLPRDYNALCKLIDNHTMRGDKNLRQLAMALTPEDAFVAQQKQLGELADPVALELHRGMESRHRVWLQAMRSKPGEFVRDFFAYSYFPPDPEEKAFVGEVLRSELKDSPGGRLLEGWGLTSFDAYQALLRQGGEPGNRWRFAHQVTPSEEVAAQRKQLAELDTPVGKVAAQVLPLLEDRQVHSLWDVAIRLHDSKTPTFTVLRGAAGSGLSLQQSLQITERLWVSHERLAERLKTAAQFREVARGEAVGFIAARLTDHPIVPEELRSFSGDSWKDLEPLLKRLQELAKDEEAMLAMTRPAGNLGVREEERSVNVGGVILPKKRKGNAIS